MPLRSLGSLQRESSKEKQKQAAALQALRENRERRQAQLHNLSQTLLPVDDSTSRSNENSNLEDSDVDDKQPFETPAPAETKQHRRLKKAGAPQPEHDDRKDKFVFDDMLAELDSVHASGTNTRAVEVRNSVIDLCDSDPDEDASPPPKVDRRAIVKPAISTATVPATRKNAADLELDEGFRLPGKVAGELYPYQVEGVKFLHSLLKQGKGGILGDDMGLGKTRQCAAFISGMFHSRMGKRVLIVAPVTLLSAWEKEFKACGLSGWVHEYHGAQKTARDISLETVQRGKGIVLTSYGMVLHNAKALACGSRKKISDDDEFQWDAVFLDEGHSCKNPKAKTYQALQTLPVRLWVLVSGTPIQNNLSELHALFDLCHPGLLGDRRDFKAFFEKPITGGHNKDATARARQLSAAKAEELRKVIKPYFLRREKSEVLQGASASDTSTSLPGDNQQQQPKKMPRKNDLVVWLRMRPLQERIYYAFLNSKEVKSALLSNQHVFAALNALKKICDHPALLSKRAESMVIHVAHQLAHNGGALSDSDIEDMIGSETEYESDSMSDFIVDDDEGSAYNTSEDGSPVRRKGKGKKDKKKGGKKPQQQEEQQLLSLHDIWGEGSLQDLEDKLLDDVQQRGAEASCKTSFVLQLLDELCAAGHRTLIFSQSLVMLNILEAGIKAKGISLARIDGSYDSSDRQEEVKRFQRDSSVAVFLLSTKVGGLGLTITEADRVIIVDPSWNPAMDNQSVDRAYRIGQKRDVVVYRLITCGTVEEKIYRRQVFKGGLFKTGTEEGFQQQYFTQLELADLFLVTAEGLQSSDTQKQLHEMHASQRISTPELDAHLEGIQKLPGCTGVSDHDLLFSIKPPEEPPLSPNSLAVVVAQEARARQQARSGGWSGSAGRAAADDLTSMMQSVLNLAAAPKSRLEADIGAAEERVEKLKGNIRSMESTISHTQLYDGGAKARLHQQKLKFELQAAETVLLDLRSRRSAELLAAKPAAPAAFAGPPPQPLSGPRPTAPGATTLQDKLATALKVAGTAGPSAPTAPGQAPAAPLPSPLQNALLTALKPFGVPAAPGTAAPAAPGPAPAAAPKPTAPSTKLQDITNQPAASAAKAEPPAPAKPASAHTPLAASPTKAAPSRTRMTAASPARKVPTAAQLGSTPLPDDGSA